MPDRSITVTFSPGDRSTVDFDGIDTTYRVELREVIVNGVQGTDVGRVFSLKFPDGGGGSSMVQESFQQVRPTVSADPPNAGEKKATGCTDIPIFIDQSPTVKYEWNYPRVLVNNRQVPSSKYTFNPRLVLAADGYTEPLYSSCTCLFVLSYGPNDQSTKDWQTIKRAFRNG